MKLSRYNIEKKEDKSCLIYNTVTSAILELDTDYEKSYYEMKEGKKCSKPDLESALLEGGMLVEDDKDEFAELLIRNKIERFADSNLTLTIAPTMACNFCCPYCRPAEITPQSQTQLLSVDEWMTILGAFHRIGVKAVR